MDEIPETITAAFSKEHREMDRKDAENRGFASTCSKKSYREADWQEGAKKYQASPLKPILDTLCFAEKKVVFSHGENSI